ncbi:MAG: DUF3416 domain-containing protein, partial [Rhizobacter sp.]|nr:DUF3416 domain-containing protein [Rhizobacter sp.]
MRGKTSAATSEAKPGDAQTVGTGKTAPAEVTPIGLADGRVRVVIESVTPAVDGGRFPVKRVVGDTIVVEADCFADGHDVVACELLSRRAGAEAGTWSAAPMAPLGNDRWRGEFVVDAIGAWEYTLRAWVDPFLSWRHDFARRVDADDLRIAARSGAALIAQAAARADKAGEGELLRAWSEEIAAAVKDGMSTEALKRL